MMKIFSLLCLLSYSSLIFANEKINVVTTTHEIAWLVEKIAPAERFSVQVLISGYEDIHYLDALPSHVQRVSRADILCFAGLGLEVGWLPRVIARAGNPKVRSGRPGHCEVGQAVNVIKTVEGEIDRSMGDVHAQGNPHFWTSPVEMKNVATYLKNVLLAHVNHSEDKEEIEKNYKKLKTTLSKLYHQVSARIQQHSQAQQIKIFQYHDEFNYFARDFGILALETLEEVPGIPPSAARIVHIAQLAKKKDISFLLAAPFHPRRHLARFQELSGVKFKTYPMMMNQDSPYNDYVDYINGLAETFVNE